MKIEHIERDGKPLRRMFMLVEVTYRDRPNEDPPVSNYYDDDELAERTTAWMKSSLHDRDDSPVARFLDIPAVLDPDIQSIARGDYPHHTHREL